MDHPWWMTTNWLDDQVDNNEDDVQESTAIFGRWFEPRTCYIPVTWSCRQKTSVTHRYYHQSPVLAILVTNIPFIIIYPILSLCLWCSWIVLVVPSLHHTLEACFIRSSDHLAATAGTTWISCQLLFLARTSSPPETNKCWDPVQAVDQVSVTSCKSRQSQVLRGKLQGCICKSLDVPFHARVDVWF